MITATIDPVYATGEEGFSVSGVELRGGVAYPVLDMRDGLIPRYVCEAVQPEVMAGLYHGHTVGLLIDAGTHMVWVHPADFVLNID